MHIIIIIFVVILSLKNLSAVKLVMTTLYFSYISINWKKEFNMKKNCLTDLEINFYLKACFYILNAKIAAYYTFLLQKSIERYFHKIFYSCTFIIDCYLRITKNDFLKSYFLNKSLK